MPASLALVVLCLHCPFSSAAGSADDDSRLSEVFVTAQRRSETLQDVAVAINVITSTEAKRAGIVGTDSLQWAAPGLVLNRQSGSGGAPFLRGVGTNTGVTGAELPVAMYVDDVYLGSPLATIFPFENLDQVEVLKGPQGTLFGRNATGGVIHVRTRRPNGDPALEATVGYGNLSSATASLYATGAVSRDLAINLSVAGEKQFDGYGFNATRAEEAYRGWSYGLRSSALWRPSERSTILTSIDFSTLRSDTGGRTIPYPRTVSASGARNAGRFAPTSGENIYSEFRYGGASLHFDHEFNDVKLVSITAFRTTRFHGLFDQDVGPANLVANDTTSVTRNFSQELQLHSDDTKSAHWIAGVFYFDSLARFDPLRTLGLSQGSNVFVDLRDRQHLHSYAGFADATAKLGSRMRLTAGLRYTLDKYDLDVDARRNAAGNVLAPGFATSDSFSKVTYRTILDWRLTPNVLAYISRGRGFKSGGYNVSTPGTPPNGNPPVSPEVLDATELGIKSEFFNHKLRINVAGFHYDYADLQVNIVVPPAILLNAGNAVIDGADLDLIAAPNKNLTLSLGASWLSGHYRNFARGPYYVPNPAVCVPVPGATAPPAGGNTQCAANLAGNATIRTPRFTGNMAATYIWTLPASTLTTTLMWYRNSGFFWEPDNRIRQSPYQLLNANVAWTLKSGKYELRLWGRNLLNEYYYYYGAESALADQVTPAQPRTYGMAFGLRL